MSSDKLAPCAPDLGRRLDEAVEFVGLEAACSTGEQRRTYTWLSELMKEARQAIATNAKATAWAEGYRWGVLDERTSAANIGIAGFNAKVEPARQNPYGVAPALAAHEAEKQAGPVDEVTDERAHNAAGLADMLSGIADENSIELTDAARWALDKAAELLRAYPAPAVATPPSPLTEQDKDDAELLALIERLEDAASAALTQAHNAGKVAHKAGIHMPSIEASAGLAQAITALRGFAIRAARAKKDPQ